MWGLVENGNKTSTAVVYTWWGVFVYKDTPVCRLLCNRMQILRLHSDWLLHLAWLDHLFRCLLPYLNKLPESLAIPQDSVLRWYLLYLHEKQCTLQLPEVHVYRNFMVCTVHMGDNDMRKPRLHTKLVSTFMQLYQLFYSSKKAVLELKM